MSVEKILNTIVESSEALLSASDESTINGLIQQGSEAYKQLLTVVEDVKFMVKATDEDQRAVLEIFQDCVTQLKDLVIQAGQYAKNAQSGNKDARAQLQSAVELINDSSRGVQETYAALSEAQLGALADIPKNTVPVSIITGFLGSGKTTLLNYILTQNHGKRIAVIENEFGEIGIDDALIQDKFADKEEIFLMNNGCICCTVRGDLIRTLGKLLEVADKFDYIMIETTGLADPAPVIQTFFTVPELGSKLRVDGVITVVDAKHVVQHIDEVKPEGAENESVEQIAFADRILLNKTDLVTPEELDDIEDRIREINRMAEVYRTHNSVVDLSKVLNIRAFDLDKLVNLNPDFLVVEEDDHHKEKEHKHDHKHDHDHDHDHHKGKDKEHKHKKKHQHDTNVTSVGLILDGDLSMEKLNIWMGSLLREKGRDIYRMKGVMAVQGMDRRFVFQGVHMIFDGNPAQPWGDDKRTNKLVLIGKHLNREELENGLKSCLA